jgi:hypothetical protein
MNLAKQVLEYSLWTKKVGLFFDKPPEQNREIPGIEIYCDSDFRGVEESIPAEKRCDCESTTGVVAKIGGRCVVMKSKCQSCAARSSTEAEPYAIAEGITQKNFCLKSFTSIFETNKPNLNVVFFQQSQRSL